VRTGRAPIVAAPIGLAARENNSVQSEETRRAATAVGEGEIKDSVMSEGRPESKRYTVESRNRIEMVDESLVAL
jgi:hypothetical protein